MKEQHTQPADIERTSMAIIAGPGNFSANRDGTGDQAGDPYHCGF